MKRLAMKTLALATIVGASMTGAKATPAADAIIKIAEPVSPSTTWSQDISGFVDFPTISTRAEYFSFSGLTLNKLPQDEVGTHWLALTDANGVSDVLKLVIGESSANNPSPVDFQMWSDGDLGPLGDGVNGFADAKNALPSGYKTLAETGLYQSVGHGDLFNDASGQLQIIVLSQEDSLINPNGDPNALPDSGATAMLLGVGSVALAAARRFSR